MIVIAVECVSPMTHLIRVDNSRKMNVDTKDKCFESLLHNHKTE